MKTAAIFLLITLTTSLASAVHPESKRQKLKARDAITLSIQEVRDLTKFVKLIPRLKSLQLTHQTPKLYLCVERLVFDLNAIRFTLDRLKHLNRADLLLDASWLKREMAHIVALSRLCRKPLRDMDEIVPSMLTRKLGDLTEVIDAVVHHVSEIERDVYSDETKVKP